MNSGNPMYWLGEAPAFDETDFHETVETDVIVCGAGVAGVSAARAAVEEGAECVLFEKCGKAQGRSGQFAVVGGRFLGRWGIDNTGLANEIVSSLMRESGYRVKQRILNYFVRHIGEDFDWYLDGLPEEKVFIARHTTDLPPAGTKLHVMLMKYPAPPNYDFRQEAFPVYPYTVQFMPSHVEVLRNNLAIAGAAGLLKTYFRTPAKKLLRDAKTGRVTGVVARGYDGRTVRAVARKGVVLATGDYAGDLDMRAWYCPQVKDYPHIPCGVAPDKKPANTGDGHKMGLWIGAKMEQGPHCLNAHNMGGAMGVTPYLQLDSNGERFMNEDCPGQKVENQLALLEGGMSWQFFDGGWPEQIPFMPVGHGAGSHVLDEKAVAAGACFGGLTPMDGYASQAFIDKSVEKGGTLRADSLEALVEKTGLPAETALASLRRYNELARRGADEDFGKKGSRMFALEKPPFYAVRITSAPLLCCHSGLESDEDSRCYDENGDLIAGLYVAGNVQGNRFAVDYPTTLPGASHSMALTFGRRAGQNAVRGVLNMTI